MEHFYSKKELEGYFHFITELLDIGFISLKYDTNSEMKKMGSESTLALYNRREKQVHIVKKDKYSLEDIYVVTHELRHAWQDYTDPEYYFGDYYDPALSEHTYNISKAEIDANAFATVIIYKVIGVKPTREYHKDKQAQELYDKRVSELEDEFKSL